MRRLIKRTAAAVLMAACLVSLSACSASQDSSEAAVPRISTEGTPVDDAMSKSIMLSAVQTLGAPDEQLIVQKKLAEAQGDTISVSLYEEQLAIREELGHMKSIDLEGASTVLLADGSYTVMIPVTFAEGTMQYVLNLNLATQQLDAEFTALSAGEETDSSMSGLLKTATVYSAIGIGTVFCVLIFISLLIYCFKFIHAWEMGMTAKKTAPAAPVPAAAPAVPAPAAAPAAPVLGPELSDDAELVAVITAAIIAYEGTSSNGLVVRSIRRVKGSNRR